MAGPPRTQMMGRTRRLVPGASGQDGTEQGVKPVNLKRGIFGGLAAATMMLSMAGAASAAPPDNSNANCVGIAAAYKYIPINEAAQQPNPIPGGNGNLVSAVASSDCGIFGG